MNFCEINMLQTILCYRCIIFFSTKFGKKHKSFSLLYRTLKFLTFMSIAEKCITGQVWCFNKERFMGFFVLLVFWFFFTFILCMYDWCRKELTRDHRYQNVRLFLRTGWKTRPRPKTVILPIKKSNQIKSNHSCFLLLFLIVCDGFVCFSSVLGGGGGVILKGFIFVNDGQTLTILHQIHTDEV